MGKKGKGTGSFGKRKNKSHTLCRRYALDIVVIDRILPRESLSERNPDDAFFFLLLRLFFKGRRSDEDAWRAFCDFVARSGLPREG